MTAVQRAAKQLSLFSETDEPGNTPGFSVRKSARARRLSIKVFPRGNVEVVVPKRTSARAVEAFVSEHREWIERSRESFARVLPPEPFVLPERVALPAIGQAYRVRYERRPNAKGVRYRSHDGAVLLAGRTDDEALCVAALKRWLTSVARREFEPRLLELAVLSDNPYTSMHIRGQRTCWGSHSSRGTISLNYCLLFLEPELLRYLMIHELCHSRHMNHSRRFWQRVQRFEPDYRRLDKALGDGWQQVPAWLGMY